MFGLKKLKQFRRRDYLNNKEKAREFVKSRVEYFNNFYGYNYNRISIKDTKTRWGSCSTKFNLNFNYKIIFLPPEIADYIIVHEICHLKEMNHSPNFWILVAHTLPNYKNLRKRLRDISLNIG